MEPSLETHSHARNGGSGRVTKGSLLTVCLRLGLRGAHNRETLFKQINARPTVFETLTGVKGDVKVAGKKRTLQEMTEKDGACVRPLDRTALVKHGPHVCLG